MSKGTPKLVERKLWTAAELDADLTIAVQGFRDERLQEPLAAYPLCVHNQLDTTRIAHNNIRNTCVRVHAPSDEHLALSAYLSLLRHKPSCCITAGSGFLQMTASRAAFSIRTALSLSA